MTDVDCVLKTRSVLGESPVWHEGEKRLYWVDLLRPAIHRFDPASGRNETLPADIGGYVGGMVFRARGGCVIDHEDGLFAYEPSSGRLTPLADPEADKPENWFNDAKCDRQGNLWAGTADRGDTKPTGSLYRFAPDLSYRRIDTGIICSNGPAFSPDGRTAYFADSYARQIYTYDIEPSSGRVGARRSFAEIPEPNVFPDGMTVDAEGFLWNAQWGGWRVVRYRPDGTVDLTLNLPVPQPTSVAFGGEGYDTLYITTASMGLDETAFAAAPLSGGIFACRAGTRGLPEPRFAG